MPLTYRRDLDRPLSIEEMDDNFETLQSSSFETSSSLEGYLPLSGSTMTGDIVLGTGVDITYTPKVVKGTTLTGGVEQTVNGIALITSTDVGNRIGEIEAIAGGAQMSSYDIDSTADTPYSLVQTSWGDVFLEAGNLSSGSASYLTVNADGVITLRSETQTILLNNLAIYADNAAAISGGLDIDNVYKTATGELRIVV